MTSMPILEIPRLQVRPLIMADLAAVHQILDIELAEAGPIPATTLSERERWLQGVGLLENRENASAG